MAGPMQLAPGPRASVLLSQAYRPAPIETPTALLGRLAVLAAGTQQQRQFEEQIAEARAKFSAGVTGGDINARLAAINEGLSSPDPQIRATAAKLYESVQPGGQVLSTPGGGSAWLPTMGGQPTGAPRPLVQGRAAAPNLLTFKDGENERTLIFDPNGGGLIDLATAPRETLQRVLPPDVFQQQMQLRMASGKAQGEATAAGLAKVAQVGAEAGARAEAVAEVKQREQAQARERYKGQAREILGMIEMAVQAEGMMGAVSPSQRDKIEGMRTAAAIALARAQSDNPEQEPNSDIVQGLKAMLPTATKGAAGITGGMDAAYALVGGRPNAPQGQPPAGGEGFNPSRLTPAQRKRMIELLQKAED